MRQQLRILGLFWGLCILAAAQETRGSLSGIVSDGSGAVVARASLQRVGNPQQHRLPTGAQLDKLPHN